jgi:hypothetical protein
VQQEEQEGPWVAHVIQTLGRATGGKTEADLCYNVASILMYRENAFKWQQMTVPATHGDVAKTLDVTVPICNERVPVGNREEW